MPGYANVMHFLLLLMYIVHKNLNWRYQIRSKNRTE